MQIIYNRYCKSRFSKGNPTDVEQQDRIPNRWGLRRLVKRLVIDEKEHDIEADRNNRQGDDRDNSIREYLKDNKGAMTVEASFIIPIVVVLIMGIVFISMFYLDMMSAKSETVRASNRVARYWKVDGDIETGSYQKETLLSRSPTFLITPGSSKVVQEGESFLSNSLKKRLVVTKMDSCSVSVKGYHVVAQVELSFVWPLNILSSYFGSGGMTFKGVSQISIDNREELLRMIGGD